MKKTTVLFAVLGLFMMGSQASAYDLPIADDVLPDSCAKVDGKYNQEVEIPCQVLEDFMDAWNVGDGSVANTLNYPHVRIAGGKVRMWDTLNDYAEDQKIQGSAMASAIGWKYSEWDYRYVIQAGLDGTTGQNKYHVALAFTRYDENDKPIPGQTFKSFYIITNVDGHWGIQFRSSMAGIMVPGGAF